jgi:thioredoxin reductase/ferredoxin
MAAQILFGLAALLGILILARRLPKARHHGQRFFQWANKPNPGAEHAGSIAEAPVRPPSLHPVFNENRCIGCGACIAACPETGALGIVDFETRLVDPSRCLGHGACAVACPMDAITLTLGTALHEPTEIPAHKPNFVTRIPALYVAGEMGGMGLIHNAIEQGRQALESIRRLPGIGEGDGLDVVIIGAGPAGFSASLAAMGHKLRYVTLEQNELGGSLLHYPRRKIIQSAPAKLPVVGEFKLHGTDKETLLERWQAIAQDTGVKINCLERVESINREGNGFLVRSDLGDYRARAVLLAIGRNGTPRTLDIPGEDLPKVVYRLINPEQYGNRRVLVVGGGDSAVEAALAIAMEQPASLTLSYRGNSFFRCQEQTRERLREFEQAGRLRVLPVSQLRRITAKTVEIESAEGSIEILNDEVIVCVGGVAPDELYKGFGLVAAPRSELLWVGSDR